MIRLLFLLLWPVAASGQTPWVDQPFISACYANAPAGQTAPPCLRQAADACQTAPGNGTTHGIAGCLQAETSVWDALLNAAYQAKMSTLALQEPHLPDQLRAAQRAWIAFRDAECDLNYELWGGGSMRSIAAADCLLAETAERALELRDLGKME
ncbi:lysozyme inhibitor LprI family protein [Aliiroseovarius sp. PTFE2010]|uniref:lysozyme inhibitor LprI family protein n=1 Tax=Aliiroseovarius sp. PTFE2010 TaxID=3417190 RepID=UPI003CF869C9